jgi:hypothetical protein
MPPLLWTILEILFGYWVFHNRRKIQRGINYLISPPPAQTEELPDTDENYIFMGAPVGAILGLVVSAMFLVAHALFFGRPTDSFSSAVYFCGILGGALLLGYLSYRNHVYPLAPNQSWRVLTEKLAARAGINGVRVRAIRNKSRRIRVSSKGVVTLPSALLRNATPDELAFHIGRALWEIQSGHAQKEWARKRNAALFAIVTLALLYFLASLNPALYGIVAVVALGIFRIFFIWIRTQEAIFGADQFALGLTGDLSAALRIIEAEGERRVSPTADIRQGLRARQNGYERARRLSEWWALQQRQAVSPVAQATPQVQQLGKP